MHVTILYSGFWQVYMRETACWIVHILDQLLPHELVHGAMGCGQKLSVSLAVASAPVRVPRKRPPTLSVTSIMSFANDEGDNEMISGAVHKSPCICLTAEENSENLS